nr:hypothetical protein GCM10020093_078830 [Planobispora longispora]
MTEASLARTEVIGRDTGYDAERALFRIVHEVAVEYAGAAVPEVVAVLRRRWAGCPAWTGRTSAASPRRSAWAGTPPACSHVTARVGDDPLQDAPCGAEGRRVGAEP